MVHLQELIRAYIPSLELDNKKRDNINTLQLLDT